MLFEEDDAHDPLTTAERQKRFRQNRPQRAAQIKTKYRRENSKWETDASYLRRDIVAWDGEGITRASGQHDYVMLAAKSISGYDDAIANARGLGTAQIFDFLLDTAIETEGALHVIYGGGYDFNMFMRDIPRRDVEVIYKKKFGRWLDYRIAWRPGKSFYICRINEKGERQGAGVTIYDVVSFFQMPFVQACDEYLGDRFVDRGMIVANKAARGTFTIADIPTVRRYNDAELTNLLLLVTELRERLNKCGLRPRRWDGPGAVAAALMTREKVKGAKADSPAPVAKAARYAYAGGRFEVVKFGHVTEPVYEYDINSAYPSALRDVPNLARGEWKRHRGDPGARPFALYHVEYEGNRPDLPGALFRRDPNGTICYPMRVTGWYWSPEIATAREYCARGYGTMRVMSAWVFEPYPDAPKPFAFIDGLYLKRRALKAGGDGAHVGIKLALNSLYGKLAQQVGAELRKDGTWRIPPFHQIEWAGYTTSWCRATILRACLDNLDDVIAFETDAVFTRAPLPVTIGTALGDFEELRFADLTYVQSGLYFGTTHDGRAVTKTRGVDRGSLTRETVLEALQRPLARERYATASLTRFVGAGVALAQSWARWRRWETVTKNMVLEPTGKRVHMGCDCMTVQYGDDGKILNAGIQLERWHATICPVLNAAHSSQFPVIWVNPDPNMRELEELRNVPNDWE